MAAVYDLTALTTVSGSSGTKHQLLNLPGISEDARDGKSRGCQGMAVTWTYNVILIVQNVLKILGHNIIENELEGLDTHLNSKPPNTGCK